jgi:hypothetical protein
MAHAKVSVLTVEIACSECGQLQTGPVSGSIRWDTSDSHAVYDRKSEATPWNEWTCDGCDETIPLDSWILNGMAVWFARNRL